MNMHSDLCRDMVVLVEPLHWFERLTLLLLFSLGLALDITNLTQIHFCKVLGIFTYRFNKRCTVL